jgi:hypothetical protein
LTLCFGPLFAFSSALATVWAALLRDPRCRLRRPSVSPVLFGFEESLDVDESPLLAVLDLRRRRLRRFAGAASPAAFEVAAELGSLSA